MEGYIKLHRKILDWGWWDDPNTCRLFLFLLLKANWEPKTWHRREILPGQLITSLGNLSMETGLTISQLRTSMNKLISTHEIAYETTRHYSLVTIIKWASYQSDADTIAHQTAYEPTVQSQSDSRPIADQSQQLKKERTRRREEVKKEEEIYEDPPALAEAFEAFREMRAAAKKKLTSKAEQMLRNKLEELAPQDETRQVAILNQSTMNGWLGVFPLREDKAKQGTGEQKSQLQRFIDLANGGIHDA